MVLLATCLLSRSRPSEGKLVQPKTIDELWLEIQNELTSIGKDSQAPKAMGGYQYTSIEHMLSVVRPLLLERGMLVQQTWAGVNDIQGNPWVIISYRIKIVSEEQVDEIPWPIVVQKGKPADKALASALSSSMTYWLRGKLLLPRGDDMDARDDDPKADADGVPLDDAPFGPDEPPHPTGEPQKLPRKPNPHSVEAFYASRKVYEYKGRDGNKHPVHKFSDSDLVDKIKFYKGKGWGTDPMENELTRRREYRKWEQG